MGKAQAGHPLRVLLVEDSPDDAELVMRELRRGGFAPNYERVDTAEAMRAALREGGWEAIIADFVMPRFSAGDALQVYKQSGLDIPFIVISGTVTDEVAVELVRTGAHDYVMKDKLVRLPPALHRELRDAATRRERREADEALRRAYNELEVRVRERTADLAAANAALQGEIARREQQRVQLSARVDELAALFDVSRTVLGVTGVQGIAHSVCELVVERFGLRMAWLGAVQNHEGEAGAGRLVPMTAVGYGRDYVDRKAVDLGDETRARTPVMRALRTLEPVNVSDIATEPTMGDAFRQAALERGYRSFLAVPLGVDDHADSVLVAYAGVEEAFDDSRVQTLQSVANLARLAMLKAELHEQVERHAETLEQQVQARTRELQHSEARWRTIFEEAPIGIGLLDAEGHLLSANPALADMLCSSQKELLDRCLDDYLLLQDGAAHQVCLTDVLSQEALPYYGEATMAGGNRRAFQVGISSLGNTHEGEQLYLALAQDVTEERQAYAALVRLERLAATGRLVAVLAHEINNPLQGVIGCLGLANEVLEEQGDPTVYLKTANDELRRIARLMASLRNVYREGDEERERVDLQALAYRVLGVAEAQLTGSNIGVEIEAEGEELAVMGVADRLHQVFLNLVLNAIDAMPKGGRLAVHLTATESPRGVEVAVTDTGSGIPAYLREQLFDPFTTTKQDGSGLGLYASRAILDQHGGWIRIESEEGEGTTATVWLPGA